MKELNKIQVCNECLEKFDVKPKNPLSDKVYKSDVLYIYHGVVFCSYFCMNKYKKRIKRIKTLYG